jgi:hypothetical protein
MGSVYAFERPPLKRDPGQEHAGMTMEEAELSEVS